MRAALALAAAVTLTVALTLGACRTAPPPAPPPEGAAIAELATSLIGAPYHFGGADAAGFDCSGLARYVHEQVGVLIPRTALEQKHAAVRVPLGELAPGDLVFFRLRRHAIDHVGIYVGDGRFIHSPRAGLAVAYGDLGGGGYYARHLVSAGRFWGPVKASRR
jgi:cell wall-associated NlpC family hydrolase